MIIYYGDPATPDQLRKIEITRTRALISARMGLTDPTGGRSADRPLGTPPPSVGALIPVEEEDALIVGVRKLGGRATQVGGRIRHGGDVTEVLALAEELWGAPTATAPEYGQAPTLVTVRPLGDALREVGL